VAQSYTIYNSCSRQPVWKLLDTPSYQCKCSVGWVSKPT